MRGSTPITQISPSTGSDSDAGCNLHQLKPASPASSSARRNSDGSNQGSASRRRSVDSIHAALFGVVRERAVVHSQPRGVVAPGFEVAHLDARGPHRGLGERERDAHLVEIASGREAGGAEQRVVGRLRVEHPAHDPAAAVRGDVTRGGVEHGADDLGGARSRRERQAERPVPGREVVAARDVRVGAIVEQESERVGVGPGEIAPHRVAERGVPGRSRATASSSARDALHDGRELGGGHLRDDRSGHASRVPSADGPSPRCRRRAPTQS